MSDGFCEHCPGDPGTPCGVCGREVEAWRKCWREGVSPELSTAGLIALRDALNRDDERLTQGQTTTPPPLECVLDWPCEGACVIGYAGWQSEGIKTVGEVEEYFADICHAADKRLGEPAGVRHLLNWFDDTPRDVMRPALLAEVNRTIAARQDSAVCGPDGKPPPY